MLFLAQHIHQLLQLTDWYWLAKQRSNGEKYNSIYSSVGIGIYPIQRQRRVCNTSVWLACQYARGLCVTSFGCVCGSAWDGVCVRVCAANGLTGDQCSTYSTMLRAMCARRLRMNFMRGLQLVYSWETQRLITEPRHTPLEFGSVSFLRLTLKFNALNFSYFVWKKVQYFCNWCQLYSFGVLVLISQYTICHR